MKDKISNGDGGIFIVVLNSPASHLLILQDEVDVEFCYGQVKVINFLIYIPCWYNPPASAIDSSISHFLFAAKTYGFNFRVT